MPKVTFEYKPTEFWTTERLEKLGEEVCGLVAEAISTDKTPLTVKDVWFFAKPHSPGTIAPDVHFEIETIGLPERKARLTRKVIFELKYQILTSKLFPQYISATDPLIWIKFVHEDGTHA